MALVLAALVVAPALTGLSALAVGEWTGVLAGIVVGAATERWFSPYEPADLKARAHNRTILS
jgi:hypothetical protein